MGEDPWVECHLQGRLLHEVARQRGGGGGGQLERGSEGGRVRRAVPHKGCIARQRKLTPHLNSEVPLPQRWLTVTLERS